MSESPVRIVLDVNAWPMVRDLCRLERGLAQSQTEREIIEARKLRFLLDSVERRP